MASVVTHFTRWPVPKADPNRYAIMVAHLENDPQAEHERLIIEALKEFEGVQTLSLDRTISLKGPVPEEMEKRGQEEAQGYLKESGASVLIWGAVLSRGNNAVYKLYWTPAAGEGRKPERYAAPTAEAQLRLPEVFWGDLADILRLQVTAGAAEFKAQEGRYVADRLPPFIARVQKLLAASEGRPGWDADAKGSTLVILASALNTLGEQSGQNKPLEEAVAAYREALKERTRERVPLDWAMTQNNLGHALIGLGKRGGGRARLEEAVQAFQEALKEYTRERVPLYWAATQHNLGIALRNLGKWERGTKRLEEAVAAYREALKERTRERVPLDWAISQNNLGVALEGLGLRDSGKEGAEKLKEAVAAYKAALEVAETAQAAYYVEMFKGNLRWATTRLKERQKQGN